jgi:threonine aldolase
MCEAEVGDEKGGEDPTVNRLNETVAELLGKEAALFLPSGTMCNEIAFRVFCRPGDELVMDKTAHTRHYETGGCAALSGATIYPLEGIRGVFTAVQVGEAIRPDDPHFPRSRVIVVEQTSNMGGGTVWPLEVMKEVCEMAKRHHVACHLDGARLMNAVVETGISAKEYAARFDSVWIDFSKGLGAPVGAGLAGSKAFIEEALRWKFQFGGAMRQAGIIAAGAIHALEHHVERLREDHEKARMLKEGIATIDGISIEPSETNMVFFDVTGLGVEAWRFNELLLERGLRISVIGKTRMRAVTHLDVRLADIDEALMIIRDVVKTCL